MYSAVRDSRTHTYTDSTAFTMEVCVFWLSISEKNLM